jgi:hypothetical protein
MSCQMYKGVILTDTRQISKVNIYQIRYNIYYLHLDSVFIAIDVMMGMYWYRGHWVQQ